MSKTERILSDALRSIGHALKEPAGGDYWAARKFLDRYDVFHGDMSGTRVLNLVAVTALKVVKSERRKAARKKKPVKRENITDPADNSARRGQEGQ